MLALGGARAWAGVVQKVHDADGLGGALSC
jgi:hypothetical protein